MYIAIGTCRERMAYWEHVDSVLAARNYLAEKEIPTGMFVSYPTYLHKGRQQIVDMFLKEEDATHLCFVDSDNTIPREAFWALAQRNLPIVGALYFGRRVPTPVAKEWVDDKGNSRSIAKTVKDLILYHKLPIVNGSQYIPSAPTLKVDVIGFGCTMIQRDVVENIMMVYDDAFGLGSTTIGEDAEFCMRAQSLGYDIHVDLGVQLGHLITYPVSVAEFMAVGEWIEEN